EGALVFSSSETEGHEQIWTREREHIKKHVATAGLVIVCAKQQERQRALLGFLEEIKAAEYPALILDDEADQATPDTTLAARTQARAGAPAQGSTTYRLTVENDAPGEAGESFRDK